MPKMKDTPAIDIPAEIADMEQQMQRLAQMASANEDRYNAEHKLRMQERHASEGQQLTLHRKIASLTDQLAKERYSAHSKDKRRLKAVPGLVLAAAAAFALSLVPNLLELFSIIGPQLSHALQTVLLMTVSACYAVIFDRTRK